MSAVDIAKVDKDLRPVVKAARAQDWTVEHSGSGHIRFASPNGEQVQVSSTPSEYRSRRNELARLKRAGLDLNGQSDGSNWNQADHEVEATACCRVDGCPDRFVSRDERDTHEVADHGISAVLVTLQTTGEETRQELVARLVERKKQVTVAEVAEAFDVGSTNASAYIHAAMKRLGAPIEKVERGVYRWVGEPDEQPEEEPVQEEQPRPDLRVVDEEVTDAVEATEGDCLTVVQWGETRVLLQDEAGGFWLAEPL